MRRTFITPLLVAFALAAGSARAEPVDEATRMAKKRFVEGVAAADAGNYEAARVAFQQAFALKPHPSVLRNLGQAELRTAHYLDAARHLSTFLRDTTFGTIVDRETVQKSLAEAEAHVGRLVVDVNVDGAEIMVDGEPVGRTPVGAPVYIEPGDRVVRVNKEGYQGYEQRQNFDPARTTQLKVTLLRAEPVMTPAASVAHWSGDLGTSGASVSRADAGEVTRAEPAGPPPAGLTPSPDTGVSARTVVRIASGGAFLVSAGVGIGFWLKGNGLRSDEDDLLQQLAGAHPDLPANAVCGGGGAQCAQAEDLGNRRASAYRLSLVGGVAALVSGSVFAATFVWPKSPGERAAHAGNGFATFAPVFSPTHAGVTLVGGF